MIELFNNLGTWITQNLEYIKTTLMLLVFIMATMILIVVFIHKKLASKVEASVDKLKSIVDDYKRIMDELRTMEEIIKTYDVTTNKSVDKMVDVENIDAQLLKKLNYVIDILGLAYSTIKNDDIRLGITSIVNNAKYIEPARKTAEHKRVREQPKVVQHIKNEVTTEQKPVTVTPVETTPVKIDEVKTEKIRRF